jgi:hypothetical protein
MLAVQWVERELDSRALTITTRGVQELSALGLRLGRLRHGLGELAG